MKLLAEQNFTCISVRNESGKERCRVRACDSHLVFFFDSKLTNVNHSHFECRINKMMRFFDHETVFDWSNYFSGLTKGRKQWILAAKSIIMKTYFIPLSRCFFSPFVEFMELISYIFRIYSAVPIIPFATRRTNRNDSRCLSMRQMSAVFWFDSFAVWKRSNCKSHSWIRIWRRIATQN